CSRRWPEKGPAEFERGGLKSRGLGGGGLWGGGKVWGVGWGSVVLGGGVLALWGVGVGVWVGWVVGLVGAVGLWVLLFGGGWGVWLVGLILAFVVGRWVGWGVCVVWGCSGAPVMCGRRLWGGRVRRLS
ncbi:hypothetical protein, partial [Pseudomonas syringae group genomosp. 7]|uniref:hypothetical protein n=1 Tax=Pseudomonas syringae group genomosp. 7 TaxID=251699 RepID=UPI00376F4DCA